MIIIMLCAPVSPFEPVGRYLQTSVNVIPLEAIQVLHFLISCSYGGVWGGDITSTTPKICQNWFLRNTWLCYSKLFVKHNSLTMSEFF